MENKWHNFFQSPEDISSDMLLRYVRKELSVEERHLVERHLLDYPYLADTVEGLEMMIEQGEDPAAIIVLLDGMLASVIQKPEKPKAAFRWQWIAAASVLILGGIAVVLFTETMVEDPETLSELRTVETEDTAAVETQEDPAATEETEVEEEVTEDLEKAKERMDEQEQALAFKQEDKSPPEKKRVKSDADVPPIPSSPAMIVVSEDAQPEIEDVGNRDIQDVDMMLDSTELAIVQDDLKEVKDDAFGTEQEFDYAGEEEELAQGIEIQDVREEVVVAPVSTQSVSELAKDARSRAKKMEEKPRLENKTGKLKVPPATGEGRVANDVPASTRMHVAPDDQDKYTGNKGDSVTSELFYKGKRQSEKELLLANPNNHEARLSLAKAEHGLKQYDKALEQLELILADPQGAFYREAMWEKANVLLETDREEEAKTLLRKLAETTGSFSQEAADKLQELEQ